MSILEQKGEIYHPHVGHAGQTLVFLCHPESSDHQLEDFWTT